MKNPRFGSNPNPSKGWWTYSSSLSSFARRGSLSFAKARPSLVLRRASVAVRLATLLRHGCCRTAAKRRGVRVAAAAAGAFPVRAHGPLPVKGTDEMPLDGAAHKPTQRTTPVKGISMVP
jgi:hypothetical protein